MKRTEHIRIIWMLAAFIAVGSAAHAAEPIRVACIGDSITAGARIKDKTQTYPAQLGVMLGTDYDVRNFGVNGRTLLKKAKPWTRTPQFKQALEFKPKIVIIKLGTNDSKNMFWSKYSTEFEKDNQSLIQKFQTLESKPRILICRPVPCYNPENEKINDRIIKTEIIPLIDRVAKKAGLQVVDLYAPLSGKPELFPDHIHPNAEGARLIAETVRDAILKNRN